MAIASDSQTLSTLIPYLVVDDPADAIDFYVAAFGAEELFRMPTGKGVSHAELRIGDSLLMLSGEEPEIEVYGPRARGGSTSAMVLYVPDVDATFAAAIAVGARADRQIESRSYGDRSGTLTDPFGHRWIISTHFSESALAPNDADTLREPVEV